MAMAMESQRSRSPHQARPGRPPPPSAVAGVDTVSAIRQYHERAHDFIEKGLTCDEQGKPDEAKAFYQSGLKAVNVVLGVNCDKIQGTNEDRDKAKDIQQKMNKTKLQIEYRLQALRASEIATPSAPEAMDVELPSYEEAVTDAQFAELGDSIMAGEENGPQSLVANATEIFSIPDGVQIFFISPEGYVSAPSYPSALKVFRFNESPETTSSSHQPSAFLQVGDWFYPLQPGSSPALQSNYGAYIFPDVQSQAQGAAVGLMIPDTVPPAERQEFEQLMHSLTMMQHQPPSPVTAEETRPEAETAEGEERPTTSTKISKGILIAAEYITWGVGKGAEKAGELLKHGSTKLKTRLQPEENPKAIDPRVQTGIQYVRKGSHTAVKVSGFIVKKLGEATMYLAKEAAPHIRREGSKLLPKSLKESKGGEGKTTMDSVLEVAASGLQGFGTIYVGLEQAAKALGKSLASETVDVVSHKYGSEAGQLTENMLYAGGNIALTAHNANNLGVKAIAKRAAKDTGKAVLNDLNEQRKKAPPPEVPPPPGNGSGNPKDGQKR